MTFCVYLNNQSVRQISLLPNGQNSDATRYIFIQGRDQPIILTEERSRLSHRCAVGVDDGRNPHYQLGYEREGEIRITIEQGRENNLRYDARSRETSVNNLPL